MAQMSTGYDSGDKTAVQALAYVSFQELATRVSHRNTGRATGCEIAEQLLSRIATDENLHMVFYRNLMAAALDVDPGQAMEAIRDEVVGFAMPGAGMANFARSSVLIAKAGIYDLRLHHDEVIMPVLRHWRVFERDGLDPRAERARDELGAFMVELDARATRFVDKRERALAGKAN
jgi:acyl-[acyl-carrier-protein] desaturase